MSEDPFLPQLILLLILIGLNALFAATEIAVISLSEPKLRRQAEEGDRRSARLLKLVRDPDRFLSTIQIGITLAGFLASAFAADGFSDRLVRWLVDRRGVAFVSEGTLNAVCVVAITVVLSFITLVFGELVPKRLAMKRPERVARATCGLVGALAAVFRPAIWLLSKTTNGILRLLRVDPASSGEEVSEDEIRMMVDIGEEKGAIETNEKEMIENIFEFNNTTAEDVMTHRTDMVMIQIEDAPGEILSVMESSGLSRFPVYRENADDIVGTINTRDYLFNAQRKHPLTLKELLRPAYFVPESVRTDVLFRDMQSRKVHIAIVVDEYGGTSGLVTMEDLLEEIVGNIYDEFDPQDEQDITQLEETLWRVAGSTELEQLAEALDIELPEDEEYGTLGGLVFSKLSLIPEDGSRLEVDACGLHIQVEELTDRRVEWALLSKLPTEEAGEE
ncbi:MAG: hemolysin family protein [Oscillospiraceae bacterium]|nr:hemolysin family protein [Oscillospiraceae bacterium]